MSSFTAQFHDNIILQIHEINHRIWREVDIVPIIWGLGVSIALDLLFNRNKSDRKRGVMFTLTNIAFVLLFSFFIDFEWEILDLNSEWIKLKMPTSWFIQTYAADFDYKTLLAQIPSAEDTKDIPIQLGQQLRNFKETIFLVTHNYIPIVLGHLDVIDKLQSLPVLRQTQFNMESTTPPLYCPVYLTRLFIGGSRKGYFLLHEFCKEHEDGFGSVLLKCWAFSQELFVFKRNMSKWIVRTVGSLTETDMTPAYKVLGTCWRYFKITRRLLLVSPIWIRLFFKANVYMVKLFIPFMIACLVLVLSSRIIQRVTEKRKQKRYNLPF
ncbi:hypothetical protein WICPIJ_002854 [Wickerhamomyces pijperi]|uniref:Uncharacterized protein n=1 Tax=Wickerhamomyces pijperi TaxID=599730 RepID=A0A9P8TPF1_WICPI|nr:hypothetical protein WICPIJ_002854 [Wickerhamomyces pijperi]